jgi:hypothetical protein
MEITGNEYECGKHIQKWKLKKTNTNVEITGNEYGANTI